MDKSLAAFFLCAGYGQRLRPLTERTPKPALTFLGRSALEINDHVVRRLYPSRRLCNVHHLYEEMERVARKLSMETLYEPMILGTGGCLWNAAHILRDHERFLVHNGDIIHTIDLNELYERHKNSGCIATFAGVFRSTHNTLSCTREGRLLGIHNYHEFDRSQEMARLTFAGIAFYENKFLGYIEPGPEDIKRYWVQALRDGHQIQVVNCSQESAWHDIGTPQGLWDASRFLMEEVKEFSYGYSPEFRENRPFVSNEVGQDGLPDHLRNVLIYEETLLPLPSGTKDCIVGRDFKWDVKV